MTSAPSQAGHAGIIWLASYPKSGNTWARLFLGTLRDGAADVDLTRSAGMTFIASSRTLLERYLDLRLADLSWQDAAELRPLAYRAMAAAVDEPILMKVHDRCGTTPSGAVIFPPEATRACVHLVRDPRDVCLSLAAHAGVPIDEAIDTLASPTAATGKESRIQVRELQGSWSSHGESWLAAPIPRLTVRYEDMVADPSVWLSEIARFCGIEADEEAIARAMSATSFATLAAKERAGGFRERPDGMARFFRAGTAGQWRAALTSDQVARIERDHGVLMRRLGYELERAGD